MIERNQGRDGWVTYVRCRFRDLGDRAEFVRSPRSTTAELLTDAALLGRRFDVPAGATIYEPETPAKNLYLITAGQVRILLLTPGAKERAVRLLEILGPGDWFGAPALAARSTYDTRALAVTNVSASEIPAERLLSTLPQHPDLAAAMIRSMAMKLQSAYSEAANLVFDDTNQRLVKTLLQFSKSAAATPQTMPEGGAGVELRITHQQLAQAIGAARETVSLALTQLRQKNLLQTGRNRLSFKPEALESFYRSRSENGGEVAPAAIGPAESIEDDGSSPSSAASSHHEEVDDPEPADARPEATAGDPEPAA